jgi:hypothetical protein
MSNILWEVYDRKIERLRKESLEIKKNTTNRGKMRRGIHAEFKKVSKGKWKRENL